MVKTNLPDLSVEETHITVEEIAFYPFTATDASRYLFRVANPLEPKKDEREASVTTAFGNAIAGRTTNLPLSHYFCVMLLRNEIQACLGKPLNRDQLRRQMMAEYPNNRKSVLKLFKKFAENKRKYINGIMHMKQPPLVLFPIFYVDGYPRHWRYRSQFVGFEFIKRDLVKEKFADPRFFPPGELERMRLDQTKYHAWSIPLTSAIEQVEKHIGKPLFDSVSFPPGYERGRPII